MDTFEAIKASSSLFWCKENLSSSESFITNQDFSSIWKFIILFTGMTLFSFILSGFIIVDYVTHFFLNVLYDFNFGISSETITSLIKDFLQICSNISTGQMNSLDSMRNCITFIDWYSMWNSISWVQNNTGGSTIWIKRQDSLNTNIEAWHIEYLEHYLCHFLSVFLWIQWSFCH